MTMPPDPLPPVAVQAALALAGLSAAFAVKHLAADFLLQTNGMARGKERRHGWLVPLLAHLACHGILTLLILLCVAPRLWWLAGVDVAIHGAIDRCKSLAAQRGGWRPDQPQFWWLLGLDQGLHQLTNIGLATALVLL
jgi:hypothetical protein